MRYATPVLATVIAAFCIHVASAAGITVSFEQKPLKQVLKALETSSGKRFAYAEKFMERTQPVTFSCKDMPLEKVLRAILQPNGLVDVLGKGKTIALTPISSDTGMAKVAGRSIRIMEALEPKLGTAIIKDGLLRVPDWADSDDRELFEAVVDIATALLYFDDLSVRPSINDARRAIEQMMTSPDADVRAGAALAFGYWRIGMSSRWQRGRNQFGQQEDQRLLEIPRRAFGDSEAIVRAAWIYILSREDMMIPSSTRQDLVAAIEKGGKDKSALVRAAIAAGAGRAHRYGVDDKVIEPLFVDKSATVRLAAKLSHLYFRERTRDKEKFTAEIKTLLTDANPLVRTLYLPLARSIYGGNPTELLNAAKAATAEDPWLSQTLETLFAGGGATTINNWQRMWDRGRGRGGRGRPGRSPFPVAKAFDLLSSAKLPLQLVGAGAIALKFSGDPAAIVPDANNRNRAKLPVDPVPTLAALAKSDNLWIRAFAAFASAQAYALPIAQADKAEMSDLYSKSLISNDVAMRTGALLGTAMLSDETVSRPMAADAAIAEKLTEASLSLRYPTAALASYSLAAGLPIDHAVGLLQQRVQAEPKLETTRVTPILLGIIQRRELRQRGRGWGRGRDDAQQASALQKRVLDAVITSRDKDLQLAFLRMARDWFWRDREGRMLNTVLQKGEPEVLEYLTTTPPISFRFNALDGVERIHKRLLELFTKGDALQKQRTVGAYAGMLSAREFYMRLRTDEQSERVRAEANNLLVTMLQESFKTEVGRLGGLDLLEAVVSPQTSLTSKWDAIPEPCIDALIKSLQLVTDDKHHGAATSILNQLLQKGRITPQQNMRIDLRGPRNRPAEGFQRPAPQPGAAIVNPAWEIGRYPKLAAAVAAAKAELFAKGTPTDKITLRIALARTGDIEMAKAIAADLISDSVPAVERASAIRAAELEEGDEGKPFAEYLLRIFKTCPDHKCAIRSAAVQKLTNTPRYRSEFVDAFVGAVEIGDHQYVSDFVHIAEMDREKANQGQEMPWLPKLAKAGLAVAGNEKATSSDRQFGYRLFAAAAGPDAAQKSEEIVLDVNAPAFLRGAAAERLNKTAPKTKIYKELAPKVGELSRDLRSKLAASAVRNMDNEGAPEFVAAVVENMTKAPRPDMGLLWQIGRQLRNNPDERIINALDPLKKDRRFSRMVQGMLGRINPQNNAQEKRPRVVTTIKLKTPEVRCVARADDGTMLCAQSEGKISVHSSDGKELRMLEGHKGTVYACVISADGGLAASAGRDRDIHIWDVPTGKLLRTCKGHTKSVQGLALSADGKMLASTGLDTNVCIWDVETGKLLRTFKDAEKGGRAVAFSPDGLKIASAGLDRTIFVWQVADGKLLQSLKGHDYSVRDICFNADSTTLASASDDMMIKIWDLTTAKATKTLTGHDSLVTTVAFLPDGKRLISAGQDGRCLVWPLEGDSSKPQKVADGLPGIWSLALSKDGKLVVLGGRSGDVLVFRVP